jgi:hypothetical protein
MLAFSEKKKKEKKRVQSILPRDIYSMILSLSSRAHPMQSRSGYRIQSLIRKLFRGPRQTQGDP